VDVMTPAPRVPIDGLRRAIKRRAWLPVLPSVWAALPSGARSDPALQYHRLSSSITFQSAQKCATALISGALQWPR
jgi:hypothetical protein